MTQTKVLSRAEIEALGGTAQHIETQYGTLELNGYHQAADGTLTIDYSYVLTKAPEVVGADASDTIGVTATDRDGSTDGSSIAIKIVDDAPQAKDDGATIAEDSSTVSGNVLEDASSGATPGPDDVADTQGADGATVTDIASDKVPGNTPSDDGSGVLTIDGQYGTLEIHPDGSYTYALDNNNLAVQGLLTTESLTDTYTYTITDGDGDSSTATLTVTINGTDDGVTVAVPVDDAATTPDGVTTDQVVFESGLTEGSATNEADTQVNASFTVKALDGLSESGAITLSYQDVDGVTQTKVLSRAEIEALGGTAQHIETQYGTLELNGYHQAADGTLTIDYSYVLTKAPEVVGADASDTIGVTATDRDGSTDGSSIAIKIVDDAPQAKDDGATIAEDSSTVSGNVLEDASSGATPGPDDVADTQGADGATVTGIASENVEANEATEAGGVLTIDGQYGTLEIHPDGSYTYALDNNNLAVQGLLTTESLTDTYTYTITDGDGDSSTATLTITINGADDGVTVAVPVDDAATTPDGVTTDQVVFESGLAEGSATNGADTQVNASFTVKALDGLSESGAITLSYQDVDGVTQTKVLSRAEIEALGGTAQHIETQYGTLELNGYHQAADGTLTIDYSYVLTKAPEVVGADASDTIGVTATDRDGSTDGSSIAIKIVDDAPQAHADVNSVREDAVDATVSGNVLAASGASVGDVADTQGADGATVTDIASNNVPGNTADDSVSGELTIKGAYGTVVIHADGSYDYTLDNSNLAVQGLTPDGGSLTDTYTYTITDGDGDSSTATLTITINGADDGVMVDVPGNRAASTPDEVTTDQVVFESGLTEGSATNEADTQVNASFTVKALDGLSESGAITLSYQDVDGVTQTKVLSRAEVEALGGTAQHIETQYGTLDLNGYHQAADGTLTIDYSYVLTKAPEVAGTDVLDKIGVTAADRNGDVDDTSSIAIKIVDDAPQAHADASSITEDATEATVSGNVLEDASSGATPGPDDVADTQGADGATVTGIISNNVPGNTADDSVSGELTIKGAYGTVVIHADGSYDYALDNNNLAVQGLLTTESLTDTYTYTITDGDGDSSTATLTITINGADDGVTVSVPVDDAATTPDGVTTDQVVFESGLAEGSATNGADTQVNASFTVKALDGLSESGAITLSYQDVDGVAQTKVLSRAEIEALGGTAQHIETQYGTLELNGYHQAADGTLTIDYSYVLTKAPEVVGADASDTIGVTATDRDGSTDGSSIAIKIVDDAPQAHADVNSVREDAVDATVSGNVLAASGASVGDVADTQGADGATVTDIASNNVPGNTADDSVSGELTIKGAYGTVVIHADGSYDYTLDNSNLAVQGLTPDGGSLTDTYTYTITDGDGDSSTATLTITINGADDGVMVDVPGNRAATTPDGVTTDQVVFESGLAEGSATNEADTQVNASFTVKALDGLSESGAITLSYQDVDGVTQTKVLSRAEIEALGGTAQHIETQYGTLELNGYHQAADGTLTIDYSYVLTKAPEVAGTDVLDKIGVTAADRNGDVDDTSSIAIKIVDDAPQAHADASSITEDATEATVSGNVLGEAGDTAPGLDDVADTQGADGATVTGIISNNVPGNTADDSVSGELTIKGAYGAVVIHADGSYDYTLDNTNHDVDALNANDTLEDTFSYTITDSDGDPSTATLTVTINGSNDDPVITESNQSGAVIEAGNLDDGTVVPGDPTVSGSFTASDVDNDTFTWSVIDPDTTYGTFSVDSATGVWTYELDNTLAATQALNEGDTVELTYIVQVNDGSGGTDTRNVTITITGTNDSPVANADTGTVKEAGVDNGDNTPTEGIPTATGNVLTNDTDVDDGEKKTLTVSEVSFDGAVGELGTALGGVYGSLVLKEDGTYTYTLANDDLDTQALHQGETVTEVFSYTTVDAMGATSTSTLTITVTGTNDQPGITSVEADAAGQVTEKGTGVPGDDTATGTLAAHDVDTGATLTWSIAGTGTNGTYGTISIDPTTGKWTYTLDDDRAATQGLNHGDTGTETFTARVTDEHGAYDEQVITVTVNGSDDNLTGAGDETVHLTEDGSATGTLQDYVSDVDDVLKVTTFKVDNDGDGNDETYTLGDNYTSGDDIILKDAVGNVLGTLTIAENGAYTFTPAENYAGEVPTVTYTMAESSGGTGTVTQTLTFEIAKVADTPALEDDKTVHTNEDTSVSLDLVAPGITDTGTGDGAITHDYSERLGEITLTLSGAGATGVTLVTGTMELAPVDGKITIVLTDVDHVSSLPAEDNAHGVYYLTKAEYEALEANPPAESGRNFTVTVSATSYEVDSTGAILPGVDGATSTQTIDVDVQAVTDGAKLSIDGADSASLSVDEDNTIDLTSHLTFHLNDTDGNAALDTDGSEEYQYSISGLPVGAVVTIGGVETVISALDQKVSSAWTDSAEPPTIKVKPPANFSGDIDGITITLESKDTDIDSIGDISTVSSSVVLGLHVDPMAGDVSAAGVTTPEDTAVHFLQNVAVTDTGSGSEVIDSVTFTVPTGWEVTPPSSSAEWSYDLTGSTATITFDGTLTEAEREAVLDGFTITPPAHSSKDETITLSIETTDSNTVNGSTVTDTQTVDRDVKITVTPVAETTNQDGNASGSLVDTDHDGFADLTMTQGHPYATPGEEDKWFDLSQDGAFDLAEGWVDQDSGEKLFARLTPELVAGDGGPSGAIGSQFKWIEGGVDHIVTYVGSPIDVPVDALGTLQFKAAPDFSGKFDIKVEAHTVDMDDDGNGVSSEATSGESHLVNILIKPVADDVTLTLSGHASGKEDTNIPLAINPTSSDPSETFVVTISGIPDGAIIYYGGVAQTAIDGSVKITDFNTATDLYISPPANSNKDFTLQVHADSVDTLIIDGDGGSPYSSINTTGPTLNIVVAMHGVADTAVVQPKIVANFTEADLDDGTKSVKLSDLVSVSTPDEDGSETLTVRVSGLPDGFALDSGLLVTDHSITGEARVWVLTEDQLADATITVPENYSGEVHFKVAGVTTEDDGDTHTGTAVPVTFTVTPSPEAVMSTSATISEDARSNVGLHIVHQHGDTDETLAGVRIDASQFTDKNFTLYVDGAPITDLTVTDGYYILSPEQAATLSAQGSENLDGDLGSFAFEYQITDAASDGSGTTTSPWTPATFEIHATAVTDQPNASITAIAGTLDTTVSDDASPDTVSVEVADIVTVNFHVDSPDTDGSEHLVRVVIDGVPDGVTVGVSDGEGGVVDGRYLGGGRWLLVYDGEDAKAIGSEGLDLSVRFDVSGQADKGVHDITMTAQVQDNGNDQANAGLVETDSVTWHLETTDVTDGPAGPAESPAPITEWAYNDTSATEDSPFTLDEKIDAGVMLPGIGTHAFTVTLTDLPGGSSVAGMVHTVIDGHDVWTATKLITVDGSTTQNDIDDALQELLHSISVTPPPNSNENNATGGFTFDADLTTSLVGGAGSDAVNTRSVTPTIPVEPVTDEATIAIAGTDSELNESDTSIPFDITVSNLADGSHGIIVDGKLYLQVGSTTSALDGGTLSLIGAGDHTLTTETDPAGLPSGTYYVIDKVDMGETLHFDYQPDTMTKGDVTVKTWVTNQEENANPVQVDNSATLTVAISNDGAQITSNAVTGGEAAVAGKESLIQLTGLQATLIDGDGSEKFHSILLSDVPSGFLVYIGNSASDAHMASNAGGQDGMNTWVISEESLTMPAYIAILPPAHWSGTLSGLELIVKSGEDSLTTTVTDTHVLEPITIDPIANGITLDPTHAFGTEGHIIPINLNAAMADATDASITVGTSTIEDTSQETTTLKLTGLGEHASFYIGGVLIDGVAYDSANGGTYTITGLTQDALHKLGFIQASSDLHDQDTTTPGMQIGVEAWTVESGNGDESVHDSNTITLNVSNQLATNGDNSLIWTGNSIDGLSGTDTVHFRQGETLSGTDLAAKLSNIETLDLSISGDNKINDLTPEQVRTILGSGGDSSGTLTVHGDGAGDKVALSGTWTNNHDGTWTGTLDDGVSTVKLIVDGGASVDETAVTPESQGLSFSPMSLMLDLPDTQSDGSTSESSFLFDQESTLPTLDSLLAAAPDASSGGAAGSTHSWLPGQETDSGTLPQPDSASGSGAAAYTAFVPDVQQPDDELHHSLAHAHAVA